MLENPDQAVPHLRGLQQQPPESPPRRAQTLVEVDPQGTRPACSSRDSSWHSQPFANDRAIAIGVSCLCTSRLNACSVRS